MKQATTIFQNQVLKNKLSTGDVILVRVMALNVGGTNMPRVCRNDESEAQTDAFLINNNKTWAAPLENLYVDEETQKLTEAAHVLIGHADSLVHEAF